MSTSHVYHHVKFRWTENLTCRFIQLRKEHGKMFTGRKYSAQSGWEYILRQMREEFPTIMADVHYRVLKKKWSNLLQQYKELKNPVHGDKNKADDISWPFYAAIDEVLGNLACTPRLRRRASSSNDQENLEDDDDLNPQEFLCVSVEPDINDEDEEPLVNPLALDYHHHQHQDELDDKVPGLLRLQPIKLEEENRAESTGGVFDIDTLSRTTRRSTMTSRKRSAPTTKTNENSSSSLLSRLPRATELTIRPIRRTGLTSMCSPIGGAARVPPLEPIVSLNGETNQAALDNILRGVEENENENEEEEKDEVEEENSRPRKSGRRNENSSGSTATADGENCEMGRLERRFVEFFEYTKRRDEENRSILMRMLKAIEDIRNSVG